MIAPAILLPLALVGVAGTISPSGAEVPANLLRLEVRFDHPMPGISRQALTLRDGSGRPIAEALLDIALPDSDESQLAVLMQPGRIKRGVGPNLALGPPLHEGETITLEVNDPRLAMPLTRSWRVTAPVTHQLATTEWAVQTPAPLSRAPLVLALSSAINASAVNLIAVAGANGQRVRGHAVLAAGETEWRFAPAQPWQPGSYQVRVHPALEDPAGNRVCAGFEARLQSQAACSSSTNIPFRVGASSGAR